ncbi:hypothetical protein I6N90_18540 [Paenibacillus sp. GSMTC-2017]|uniref:hypothetical protein n=1 Tax=Paenibacillus sp. GSMTC-2017 TaxID=2794350 RepID=UPI0018D814EA|nr:hypothetical protein [Paenibacillus sp. GSMTC-2017]MBH5319801.1 hypothetical protein [Paenibacillus sp. GSMTC-2017]
MNNLNGMNTIEMNAIIIITNDKNGMAFPKHGMIATVFNHNGFDHHNVIHRSV